MPSYTQYIILALLLLSLLRFFLGEGSWGINKKFVVFLHLENQPFYESFSFEGAPLSQKQTSKQKGAPNLPGKYG